MHTTHGPAKDEKEQLLFSSSKTQRSLINDTRPAQHWSVRCSVWNSKETLSSLRLTCFLHFKHIQCVWLIYTGIPLFLERIHILYEPFTHREDKQVHCVLGLKAEFQDPRAPELLSQVMWHLCSVPRAHFNHYNHHTWV